MCEQHQGLATKEVKRISPAVALRSRPDAPVTAIEQGVSEQARRISTILPPAIDKAPLAVPAAAPTGVKAVQKTPSAGEQVLETANPDENPRKAALVGLLQKLETMEREGKIPGKKQTQRQIWMTTQLAELLQVQMPMNVDANFGKSEGFRRNLFSRIRAQAEQILGKDECANVLPKFMQ